MSKQLTWPLAGALALGLLSGCPEDGPTPSDSPTPSETVTNPDGTPTATGTATPTGSDTQTPSPTASVTPTTPPTPTPTGADTPTPTGIDTPTPTGVDTPTPTGIDTPTPTGVDTPTATPTAPPTPTPKPTPPPNTPPTVALTSPSEGGTFPLGQGIPLAGTASDLESQPQDLTLTVVSSIDGEVGTTTPDAQGVFALTLFNLSAGVHTLTIEARDPAEALGTTTLTLTVEALAGAPTVEILSPTTLRVQVETEVAFDILVADDADAADTLAVTVSSDLDGVLFEGAPDAEGHVTFATSALSRGHHTLSVQAEDSESNVGSGGLLLTVNGPPTAPVITLSPEEPNTTTGLLAEAQAQDVEGDPLTYTFSWTLGGEATAYEGQALPETATTRGELWAVTVVASDPDVSGPAATAEVTIGNAPPTSTGATLTPATASALSTLTCAGQGFEDADGDAEGWSYSWLVGGEEVLGAEGKTLTGAFVRGDVVVCRAAPFDGLDLGAPLPSASVTIDNAPPTVSDVTLLPFEGATEESTLTCEVGTLRDGDDDDVEIEIVWLRGTTPIAGASGTTLTGDDFDKGDTIACRVTPTDGTTPGAPQLSNPVFIVNSPPVATLAAITPETPTAEDTLTCAADGEDADPADTVSFTYAWSIDGAPLEGAVDVTLSASVATRGQAIRCQVTPFDGAEAGAPLISAPVTLDNTAPSIESVDLSPTDPQEADTLTCAPSGFADAEDDAAIYLYAWTVGGEDIAVATADLSGLFFDKGDEVACSVTPSDGFAEGETLTSNAVVVLNTAPVASQVSILPLAPTVESTLTCGALLSDDDAADAVTANYSWSLNGETLAGETSATLEPGSFQSGDEVTCTVTPSDGETTGSAVTSAAVTFENLAPSAPAIALAPLAPLPGEALMVSVTAPSVDPDGGEVSYTYTWTVNGEATTYAEATLPGFTTQDGDVWVVSVQATDGSAVSASVEAAVTVFEPDADGDGYGVFMDCDDANPAHYPGAPELINGLDDDCDGVVDNRWDILYPYGHDDNGAYSAIDVYTPGVAQMVYLDSTHARVQFARVENDSILYVDTVDSLAAAADPEARPLDIAVDDLDIPHVALVDTEAGTLIYATRIGERWFSMSIAADAGAQARPAIAVDGYGLVHILYRATGGRLVYMRGFFGLMETREVDTGVIGDAFHDIAADPEGGIHMAWRRNLGGDLYYAGFDGLTLSKEPVVTAVNAGMELRIAVDPVSYDVHVAYVNDNTGIVTHVVGTAGDWQDVSAASIGALSGPLGLAVNPATGGAHILVHDAGGELLHLYREGRGWQNDVAIDLGEGSGLNPAAAMDTNQRVIVSAYEGEGGFLLYGSAPEVSDWSFTFYSVDSYDSTGSTNDVAVTADGRAILYASAENPETATKASLALSYVPGKGYLSRSPNSGATTHRFGQVELGANGARDVLEWDPTATELALMTSPTGQTWTRRVLASDLFTSGGASLDATASGGVFVAYTDYYGSRPIICGSSTPYYTALTLSHRKDEADTFGKNIVGYACSASTLLPITHTSVVANGSSVHIALYADISGDLIYLVGNTDGVFSAASLAVDTSGNTGYRPAIAVNPATGQPGIASINRDTGFLRYSTRGAAGIWLTVNVERVNTGGPVGLRYDDAGAAHLLYKHPDGDRIMYATNKTGIFVTEPILTGDGANAFGSRAGLELDANGNPHVTFFDAEASDLVYARGKMNAALR